MSKRKEDHHCDAVCAALAIVRDAGIDVTNCDGDGGAAYTLGCWIRDTIRDRDERIAELEPYYEQWRVDKAKLMDATIRNRELEEALADAIEHVRLWSGNGETDNRARWSKALAGKGGVS